MLFLLRNAPEGRARLPRGICAMKAGRSGSLTSKALHTVWPALGVPGSSSCSCATYSSVFSGLVHSPCDSRPWLKKVPTTLRWPPGAPRSTRAMGLDAPPPGPHAQRLAVDQVEAALRRAARQRIGLLVRDPHLGAVRRGLHEGREAGLVLCADVQGCHALRPAVAVGARVDAEHVDLRHLLAGHEGECSLAVEPHLRRAVDRRQELADGG